MLDQPRQSLRLREPHIPEEFDCGQMALGCLYRGVQHLD